MRRRLSEWYAGTDVPDPEQRTVVIQARRGDRDPDVALVDAAIQFRRDGHLHEAEDYFLKAISRNQKSWRAHREYGEFFRDQGKIGNALDEYEHAARHAPKKGADRALIFREYGLLLRGSGRPDGLVTALEKLEVARAETPNDVILLHATASCLVKLEQFRRAIPILETLVCSSSAETRARSYDLLDRSYQKVGEKVALASLRTKWSADKDAAAANTDSRRSVKGSSRPMSEQKPRR